MARAISTLLIVLTLWGNASEHHTKGPQLRMIRDDSGVSIRVDGQDGHRYFIDRSTDGHTWQTLGTTDSDISTFPVAHAASAVKLYRAHVIDQYFHGPFEHWIDVKRDFGAVGDGVADDTAAIQGALNQVRWEAQRPVVYIPAGTYRITKTLRLARSGHYDSKDVMVLGEDPSTTHLIWDGPAQSPMLQFEAWFSRIGRLTMDGRGTARSGIVHGNLFTTGNEITDMVFRDLDIGIEAGGMNTAPVAETVVRRCRFVRCEKMGVSIQNFNSLDWFVWDCVFEDCGVGVGNPLGAGQFHVYRSRFRNSKVSDVYIGHTEYFSIRNCWSSGSRQFLVTWTNRASAQITLQGNTIANTSATPVHLGNLGPLLLIDNTIDTGPAPAVAFDKPEAELFCIGNRFSTIDPVVGKDEFTSIDDQPGDMGLAFKWLAEPDVPPRFEGITFRASTNTPVSTIQQQLDHAAAIAPAPVMIHLRAGVYRLAEPLIVRRHSNVHLVGDGAKSVLKNARSVAGGALHVEGPTRLTLRDLAIHGGYTNQCLVITGCDQTGARIYSDQLDVRNAESVGLSIEAMRNANLGMEAFYHSFCKLGVQSIGDPSATEPRSSSLNIFGGASIINDLCYDVRGGGRILVQDMWFETHEPDHRRFVNLEDSGAFTLHGANIAPRYSDHEPPAVQINDFDGRVSFIATRLGFQKTRLLAESRDGRMSLLMLGLNTYVDPTVFASDTQFAQVSSHLSMGNAVVEPMPSYGNMNPAFLRTMLSDTREQQPTEIIPLRPDVADIRIHRVFAERGDKLVVILP